MYAANNSVESGSVAYECEGHETRLSDCISPLSSTKAPCYYALVKCFYGRSTTSGLSAGIVAGVVVSLLAVLLLVASFIIILIVWLRRRATKNLKPACTGKDASTTSPKSSPTEETFNVHDNLSYQPVSSVSDASNAMLLQENPSYQPTTAVSAGIHASNAMLLQENPSYQPTTAVSSVTEASNMMLLQENPSYQPTTAVSSVTEASNAMLLQENPSYQPTTAVSSNSVTDASNTMVLQKNPSYQPIFQPPQIGETYEFVDTQAANSTA